MVPYVDKSCSTSYSGGDKGFCYPPDLGGECLLIPSQCDDCNKIVDCSYVVATSGKSFVL